ncbi:coiled-coil domain-containing protein 177-like isoform X2 [Anneissia japonica]|uniref:coiled-coil domain-containing protein 177-like isoform X2 n=1 Tax=Anneissia japonica TaxID=1529436 RepID=UPI00142563EB|nr:coiled-coil domain-containing protein 177-like isoform X2 [Anneissia japonica]
MMLNLDLYNFESVDAEDCRYILTSPRSLEACTRLGVKPMELLHKPLNDLIEDDQGVSSLRHLQNLYEARERQRLDLLKECRQIREKIIHEERGRSQRSISRAPSDSLYQGDVLSADEPAQTLRDHVFVAWEEDAKKQRMRERKFQEKLAMRNELIQKERLKQKRVKVAQQFIEHEEQAHLKNALKEIEQRNLRSQSILEEQEKIRRHQLLLKLEEQRHRKKKQERALKQYEEDIEDYQHAIEKHQHMRLSRAEEQRLKELKSKQVEVKNKNRKKKVFHQARKKCIDEQSREDQKVLEENIQLKQINMDRVYRNQSWQKTQHMLEKKQKEAKQKLKNQQTQKQYQEDLKDWQAEVKNYVTRAQQRASVRGQWTAEQKALRAHESRVMKEKTQQTLMKKVQEDDDLYRKYLSHQIAAKDARSKRFSEQREETKQILRSAARRSSLTSSGECTKTKNSRSFDKMVKDAELRGSLSSGPQLARKNVSSLWLT